MAIIHRPTEQRSYTCDFSKLPEFVAGDSLTGTPTATWTVTDGNSPQLGSPVISGLFLVLVTVGKPNGQVSGTDGVKYKLEVSCATAGGSYLTMECELWVSTRVLT